MRILLIVSSFAPCDRIGALRWRRYVKFLSVEHNFTIIVYSEESHEGLKLRDSKSSKAVNIYECGSPVNLFSKMIKKLVSILPLSLKIRRKLSDFPDFPDSSWWWGKNVLAMLNTVFSKDSFDVVISSHPSIGCHRAAAIISKSYNIPWVADFRDPFAQYQHLVSYYQRIFKPILYIFEQRVLRTVSCVVSTNEEMSALISTPHQSLRYAISNCYDAAEFSSSSLNQKITVTYTGSIGPCVELDVFMEGLMRLLTENSFLAEFLDIRYYGNSFNDISSHRYYQNLADLFHNEGMIPRSELLSVMSASDLLLAFAWKGPHPAITDSGKTYDYLGTGRPVLVSATNMDSKMAQIIDEVGAGAVTKNAEEIKDFLNELITDRRQFLRKYRKLRLEKDRKQYELKEKGRLYDSVLKEIVR